MGVISDKISTGIGCDDEISKILRRGDAERASEMVKELSKE